jgi:hypothetical protein
MSNQAMHEAKVKGGPVMNLEDGTLVQGDGSSSRGADRHLVLPKLYIVREGKLHLIRDAREFRKAGYDRSAVQVIPDAELKKLPVAVEAELAPGQQIVLDLDTFLGAGHYMTTYGVLRKTADGGHVDATTRTRTITMFGGFHGGVNMIYSDAEGFPVGMSATQRYGVDGTWIGRSDRTDYWSEELSEDQATRTTTITLAHFWMPDQLDDVVRRGVEMLKPIVGIIKDIVDIGGKAKSS